MPKDKEKETITHAMMSGANAGLLVGSFVAGVEMIRDGFKGNDKPILSMSMKRMGTFGLIGALGAGMLNYIAHQKPRTVTIVRELQHLDHPKYKNNKP